MLMTFSNWQVMTRSELMEPFCWRRLRLFQPSMGVSPTTKATVQHITTASPARRRVTTHLYLQTKHPVSRLPTRAGAIVHHCTASGSLPTKCCPTCRTYVNLFFFVQCQRQDLNPTAAFLGTKLKMTWGCFLCSDFISTL